MSQMFQWYIPSLLLLTWVFPKQDNDDKWYRRRISVFHCIHHTSNWRSGWWGSSHGVAWLILSFVDGGDVCWQTGKSNRKRVRFCIIQTWLAVGVGMRSIGELEDVCLNLPSSDTSAHMHAHSKEKKIWSALNMGSIWGMALKGHVKWVLLGVLRRGFPCLSAFLQWLGCLVP